MNRLLGVDFQGGGGSVTSVDVARWVLTMRRPLELGSCAREPVSCNRHTVPYSGAGAVAVPGAAVVHSLPMTHAAPDIC